jgi:hypothetical protein
VRREWQRNGITRTSTTFPIVYLSLINANDRIN